ncbi:hypothetical protein IKF12_01490 [Candidatus Saccharibacteria bacterium]|nr:hypothetical protein [Candidatus Saccharibacteria bacterium]
MVRVPFDTESLYLLEKEISYFDYVVRNLKNNISWIEGCARALQEDIGATVNLDEKLGFSLRKVYRGELARKYRAQAAVASIRAGDCKSPQHTIGANFRSINKGKAHCEETVGKIRNLYYDLEEEYSVELDKLG